MNTQESDVRAGRDPDEEASAADEHAEAAEGNPSVGEAAAAEEAEVYEQDGAPAEDDEMTQEDALRHEAAKWREAATRTAADLENYRKRAAREREEAVRYANQSVLEDLLPVLDNFEMGMQAASKDEGSMIYVGMDMVRKQFQTFLENCGVKEVEAEGCEFDPNMHDAVSQEPAEDASQEGKVLRVTRRGYMLRDRLLRPASVVVASAPGEDSEADEETGED